MTGDYQGWTHQQLIARIQELEQQLPQTIQTPLHDMSTAVPAFSTNNPTQPSITPITSLPYRKPPKQAPKPFDATKYSTRLIALKFAYLGQKYNGFEHHRNNTTPLPTIEEELWKALVKTRLISPVSPSEEGEGGKTLDYGRIGKKEFEAWERDGSAEVNWEGCEYSKCGRTDRGVSAFGQVVGVRVRSNGPLPMAAMQPSSQDGEGVGKEEVTEDKGPQSDDDAPKSTRKPFNEITDELPYIQLLNRVLPPEIRVYAWCPKPPSDFSARFSCKERRYKYFFTNPCFAPLPGSGGLYSNSSTGGSGDGVGVGTTREGWLDINAMRTACKSLVGLHDFRNFCKIDASKQLTNFKRRIFFADIEEVSDLSVPSFLGHPALSSQSLPDDAVNGNNTVDMAKTYSFTLHGSAFLWHQVRSLIAVLFLIGQRLESPSLIPALLDISANPTRPKYEMASDAPLVLWDCIFPAKEDVQSAEERESGYDDALEWVYVGDDGGVEGRTESKTGKGGKWGRGGVVDDVWEVWRRSKMEETLAGLLLDRMAGLGKATLGDEAKEHSVEQKMKRGGTRVFDGGDVARAKGNYVPVLCRERQEPVEVINERYAKRKGLGPRRAEQEEDVGDE